MKLYKPRALKWDYMVYILQKKTKKRSSDHDLRKIKYVPLSNKRAPSSPKFEISVLVAQFSSIVNQR